MAINTRTLKIAGVCVAVVLVLLVVLPFLIPVNSFRPKIESMLTDSLGRKVTLGKLGLSIIGGSVSVDDVKIADDPAFSQAPFITAKSLDIGVELIPLIFSKQLNVTDIMLEEPKITLLKSANGTWNFSSLGGKRTTAAETSKGGTPQLSIGKLEVKDGKLSVGQANSSAAPQVYEKLNATMKNFSPTKQFPFEVTVNLPGGGDAKLTGKAGPMNPQDSSKTPFEATIKVKDLNLAKSGFVDAASGIDGLADLDGTINSNGTQAKAAGTVECSKLKLSPKGSPAPKTVTIKYGVISNLAANSGTVTQGDIALGKAAATLTGSFQSQGATTSLNMRLNAPNLPVDEIQDFLPAMGVTMPSGSKLKGGTLSAELAINGPLDRLVIAGPVRMSNAKLAGFDMGAKLGALSAFTGKGLPSGGDTTIQNASLNAHVSSEMTRAESINVTVPSLGVVTGGGTISPAGALNFKMSADLQTAGQRGSIPFIIQGTTSNPSFVPDVGSMATSAIKGAIAGQTGGNTSSNPISGITGLFGKKKK